MAKSGRGQTRRNSKRRVLRPGENVRADGKYQYKYHIDGKPHFVYSWRLEPTDKLPPSKKPCLSLRELEKKVNFEIETLQNMVDGQMMVCELVDQYLKTPATTLPLTACTMAQTTPMKLMRLTTMPGFGST